MRRKIERFLFIILCVMLLPVMVNAKEKCTVVSGNKTDIGSEIACGSEHFYVINSDDKEVKMLAKYNLDVGISVHKEKIEKAANDTRYDEDYCNDLAEEKGGVTGQSIEEGYCFYFTYADFSNVKQREDAKSTHVDENDEYLFPQIGSVYPALFTVNGIGTPQIPVGLDFKFDFSNATGFEDFFNEEKYDNHFADLEPILAEAIENDYYSTVMNAPSKYSNELGASLYYYKNNLSDYSINDVTLMTLEELNDIAKARGNAMSYQEIYDAGKKVVSPDAPITKFGNIKGFFNKEDAWLYDRSYWLRTGYMFSSEDYNYSGSILSPFGLLFVDNLGNICGAGSLFENNLPGCQRVLRVAIGSGIRPVITMAPEDIYEPPKPIVNPQTGSAVVLVLVGLCGLLFIGRKTLKRFS